MTAPDQYCINVKKLLSIRRRPHMTQSGHRADQNLCSAAIDKRPNSAQAVPITDCAPIRRLWLRDASCSRLRNGREQMTDIDRYREGAEYSAHRAREVGIDEIRQIWLLIERSYRFLVQREERVARVESDAFEG